MAPRPRHMEKSVHSAAQAAFRAVMIKARRKKLLTQQELADRLGKPQSFVSKYEGGERRLDVIEFLAISQAIEVDPVALLRSLLLSLRDQ